MDNSNSASKLSIKHVSKSYSLNRKERIKAIDDVSFDINANEMCVMLGPSGCGKSTVLRLVAGLEVADTGSLSLDGNTITAPDEERGMVFQAYTSFDWLSVQKNVEYGMRLNGMPKKERRERAAHYIKLVGLTKFRKAYPKQLSGGMKQRVAIARTLANNPALLLLDEPFGALDAETRWHMQEFMVGILQEASTTGLLVTHDIEEGIFLADRIFFLSKGPGTVIEEIPMEFKNNRRVKTKEELFALDGYAEVEEKIMKLMRQEGSGAD